MLGNYRTLGLRLLALSSTVCRALCGPLNAVVVRSSSRSHRSSEHVSLCASELHQVSFCSLPGFCAASNSSLFLPVILKSGHIQCNWDPRFLLPPCNFIFASSLQCVCVPSNSNRQRLYLNFSGYSSSDLLRIAASHVSRFSLGPTSCSFWLISSSIVTSDLEDFANKVVSAAKETWCK